MSFLKPITKERRYGRCQLRVLKLGLSERYRIGLSHVVSHRSSTEGTLLGGDHNVAVRAFALGFAVESEIGDSIVHDLTLIGAHRL